MLTTFIVTIFNSSIKRFNKFDRFKSFNQQTKGFTLFECAIAIILIGIVLGGLIRLGVTIVKNDTFNGKFADSKVFITQKGTDLFKDIKNQISKIPSGQTRVGSVDPMNPVSGYYDFMNESGCIINPILSGSRTGNLGDLGIDTPTLDCSRSTSLNPSTSTTPIYRRQWIILKDFPSVGDITTTITIVYQHTNEITDTYTITKTDGSISK